MNLKRHYSRTARRQEGTAVIVVITILSLLLIYVMGNVRALDHFGKELRLIERRQKDRIQMPQSVPTSPVSVHSEP